MVTKLEYPSTKVLQFLLLKILKRFITDSALLWSVEEIDSMCLCKVEMHLPSQLSYYPSSFQVLVSAIITALNI